MGHITQIDGISIGHVTDQERHTGITAVIFSREMALGVDVRGGAPGTRETDVFNPLNLVETADAVVLCGGSAYGLTAASGVMKYLKEKGRGVETGYGKVPIVPGAVIFDLPVTGGYVPPTEELVSWGYRAAESASNKETSVGNVGAGAGATVGKIYGMDYAVKSGIGSALVEGAGGLKAGAIAAVNPLGDVIDPKDGKVAAGVRSPDKKGFADARKLIKVISFPFAPPISSTIVALVAVNGNFSKVDMNRIARMAHDGIARVVYPSHTMLDGDTIFAVAAGDDLGYVDVTVAGALAAEAMSLSILDAVRSAVTIEGYPSMGDV
ncbi:MAG: P1 family peptidase [Deltaproteobacteria bacterium]|uniref:P1 family peptidase n=1 Tax=Candidatus Zymogenus saltonus TaxID=2844893 RepID=A0A9D8PSL6_9DELT|nr:P1 family peptidase [Candidatus Zymogenus saltonus]